jgi:CHAD domain-containing protein
MMKCERRTEEITRTFLRKQQSSYIFYIIHHIILPDSIMTIINESTNPVMKKKEIKALLKKKLRAIEKLSSATGHSFEKNIIHDFRLSIKSLRSFLRLLKSCAGKDEIEIHQKIRRLYHIAGVIRQSELEKEFLIKMKINVPSYIDSLEKKMNRKKREWRKCYSRKVISNSSRKIMAHKYEVLHLSALDNFISKRLMQLVTLKNSVTDAQLHEIRKNVKDILYISGSVDKKLWDSVRLSDELTARKLQELTETIGSYNDERIMHEHLNAFSSRDLSNEEETTIKQFKSIEKKKLKLEKKLVLKATHLSLVKIHK